MQARCSICLDFFSPTEVAAIACGHTFHQECLFRWLNRSMSCPTCRYPVRGNQDLIRRLIFDYGHNGPVNDECKEVAKNMDGLKADLAALESKINADMAQAKGRLAEIEKLIANLEVEVRALKEEIKEKAASEKERLLAEITRLRQKLRLQTRAQDPKTVPAIRSRPMTIGGAAASTTVVTNRSSTSRASQASSSVGARPANPQVRNTTLANTARTRPPPKGSKSGPVAKLTK